MPKYNLFDYYFIGTFDNSFDAQLTSEEVEREWELIRIESELD